MTTAPPRIALIHATALAVYPIQAAFERHWPQARRMNLLDDSLAVDLAEVGEITPATVQRFIDLSGYAMRTGCDGILFTCTAFGPALDVVAASVDIPALKPNEAMFEEALARSPASGARLGLIATFEDSIPPMSAELLAMAKARGCNIVLETRFVLQAMDDLARGEAALHHAKVARAALELRDCDVVMLAQFSMAAAQPETQAGVSCPVLSSPDCAVLALKKRMSAVEYASAEPSNV